MKLRFCLFLIFLTTFSALLAFPRTEKKNPLLKNIRFTKLQLTLPKPTSINLSHGVSLIQMKDEEVPLVSLDLYFNRGLNQEPISQAGLLEASLELMKKGGTKKLKGSQFHIALAEIGAEIDFSYQEDSWTARLKVLRKNFSKGLEILEDVLINPHLPIDQLASVQNQMKVQISRRNDRPTNTAKRRLAELMYPSTRRGYFLQNKDIERITQEMIQQELHFRIHPQNMYIAASGDIHGIDLKRRLESLIASLEKHSSSQEKRKIDFSEDSLSKRNSNYRGKILLIRKPASQAVVRVGAYLPPHNSKDFYSIQLANYVLGGGSFVSRLVREIRTKQGLAYYAYSYSVFRATDGTFTAGFGTQSDKAHLSLKILLDEIQKMKKGVKLSELSLAKESVINGLIFQFETARQITAQEIRFRMHQMPSNYIQLFPSVFRALQNENIKKIHHYWNRKNLYIIVVGPKELEKNLAKIAPVIVKEPEELLF